MKNQNSSLLESRKGLIIGIVIGVMLLLLIFIIAVIGAVGYWHWTTTVNS